MKTKIGSLLMWLRKRTLLQKGLIIAVIIGLVGYFGFKMYGQPNTTPQYQTSQAETGTLITSVTASGTISSASSASINSSATGVVKEVYFSNGDSVFEGDIIAEITLDRASQQKAAA